MKKILFIASDNNFSSGAFRSMVKLCELLKKEFEYAPIVVLPCDGDGEKLLDDVKVEYVKIKSYNWVVPLDYKWSLLNRLKRIVKKSFNRIAIKKIVDLIKEQEIELVHSNTTYTYVGAIAAKKAKIPCVWHLRELLEEDQNNHIWEKKGIQLINSVTKVVAISDFVYEKYKQKISKEKLIMLPNGIAEENFYLKRKKNNLNSLLQLVCVGGLYGGKGQDIIIKACDELQKRGIKNFHIDMVGDGNKKEEYEKLMLDLKVDKFITFCGKHKNVMPYYAKADIMVMSSKAEAFGRTTVEAMMAGCAIIGSNSGATPEILSYGQCGYLYEKGNYIDLADKIEWAIKNREALFDMAMKGQSFALENFTAKLNATKISELYKEIEVGN